MSNDKRKSVDKVLLSSVVAPIRKTSQFWPQHPAQVNEKAGLPASKPVIHLKSVDRVAKLACRIILSPAGAFKIKLDVGFVCQ